MADDLTPEHDHERDWTCDVLDAAWTPARASLHALSHPPEEEDG
jgi:hypothetical protein